MKIILTGFAFAALAAATPAAAQQAPDPTLAAAPIAQGEHARAIVILERQLAENPDDPALLINLGIAHAQRGDELQARENFEAAMGSRESVDLETANGSLMDSRRLARRALSMLDRGAFASDMPTRNLSLRQ